ncbi:MAG: HD domain-containing protein [Clostridia bacterium]|nr:HD domain-containing protein [Clostridia bacterium]
MAKYDELPLELSKQIESDIKNGIKSEYACLNERAVRLDNAHDRPTVLRPPFIRDVDKILNCPFYNRYADKTQVFSFYKNDDITRRSLHVQLVSRIARTIGRALGLNLDLIEAISLGHDLGHTPFGHIGESYLDELYFEKTGKHFYHNLQSVRVLNGIFNYNITLQTLDGIVGHNGEIECAEYKPKTPYDFSGLYNNIEKAQKDKEFAKTLSPFTLEGCVVRVADIIAYLGKDRQDGTRTKTYSENDFVSSTIGSINAEIVNNLTVNIIKNSYGKNYLKFDEDYFLALKQAKSENYKLLYNNEDSKPIFENKIKPAFKALYNKLLKDLVDGDKTSPIFKQHINYIKKSYYKRKDAYESLEPNQIVVDFIASMTDDYFIEVYNHLFKDEPLSIKYKGYFD